VKQTKKIQLVVVDVVVETNTYKEHVEATKLN
jgi:hypothetical protein